MNNVQLLTWSRGSLKYAYQSCRSCQWNSVNKLERRIKAKVKIGKKKKPRTVNQGVYKEIHLPSWLCIVDGQFSLYPFDLFRFLSFVDLFHFHLVPSAKTAALHIVFPKFPVVLPWQTQILFLFLPRRHYARINKTTDRI